MRSIFTAAAVTALAAVVSSLPTSTHVLHEKRSGSTSWAPDERMQPDPRIKLPVRIGLKENNLDLGHDLLMQVSEPDSEHYGKHWSPQQVKRDTGEVISHAKTGIDCGVFRPQSRVYRCRPKLARKLWDRFISDLFV